MEYITTKRARFHSLSGHVNIPCGTPVQCVNGVLSIDEKLLCADHSQNAYDYFARDDDGNGLERGRLTRSIIKTLAKNDRNHQARWDKVWDSERCQRYKREDHSDYWLWNHDFYNASILDLRYIAALVGAKGVK